MREKLIAAGVKNLREFGYPSCNETNILTDLVFRKFFISMLNDNKGHGKVIDDAIDGLIAECEANEKPEAKKRKKAKKR